MTSPADENEESSADTADTDALQLTDGGVLGGPQQLRSLALDSGLWLAAAAGLFYLAGTAYYGAYQSGLGFPLGTMSTSYKAILLKGFLSAAVGLPLAYGIYWGSARDRTGNQAAWIANGCAAGIFLVGAFTFLMLQPNVSGSIFGWVIGAPLVVVPLLLFAGAWKDRNVMRTFRHKGGRFNTGILIASMLAATVVPGPAMGALATHDLGGDARPGVLLSEIPRADVEFKNQDPVEENSTLFLVGQQGGFFYFSVVEEDGDRQGLIIPEGEVKSIRLL